MIKRATHPQNEPLSTWSVTLPEGAVKGRPLAAYSENGNSMEWDSWRLVDGVLQVDFGIDPVIGSLEWEYQVEGEDPVILEGNGGVINIHVTQNNSPRA